MKPTDPSRLLTSYRNQARRLLRDLRTGNGPTRGVAAARFRRLRSLVRVTATEMAGSPERVRLKHALAVIALENGHPSWAVLKAAAASGVPTSPPMYERGMEVLLNRWFATYEAARRSLDEDGGFLLPYREQFFICEAEGIRILGLDPDDPDWAKIDRDWVRPTDGEAWRRLEMRRLEALA